MEVEKILFVENLVFQGSIFHTSVLVPWSVVPEIYMLGSGLTTYLHNSSSVCISAQL